MRVTAFFYRRRTAILVGGVLALAAACARHADLRDEPDSGIAVKPVARADAIPTLDTELGTEALPPCDQRPPGVCVGPVDFPCALDYLVGTLASQCQRQTGCRTNGWLRVTMNAEGCVQSIGMDQPNDAIVACLVAELGNVSCPCPSRTQDHFFGLGHTEDGTGTTCE